MNIILDSNIIIDILNGDVNRFDKLAGNTLYTYGIIKSEILVGAKNQKGFEDLETSLSDFEYLSFHESYWDELSLFRYRLKKNGMIVPYQDAMIALLAIRNNCFVLTRDKHFELIQSVFNDLNLYGEDL